MRLADRSTSWDNGGYADDSGDPRRDRRFDDDGFYVPGPGGRGPAGGDRHGYDEDFGELDRVATRPWARWLLSTAMIGAVVALVALGLPEVRHRNQASTAADASGALRATLTQDPEPAPLAYADTAATGLIDPATGAVAGSDPAATGTPGGTTNATTDPAGAAAPATGGATATTPTVAPGSTAANGGTNTTARPAATSTTARPATTAPPTTTQPDPGGACWKLVNQDDFNGSSLNTSLWTPYNSAGNGGNGLRRSSAISVGGGSLRITAEMANGSLVSGGMSQKYTQTYGRYEVRVRTDADPSGTMSGVVMTWPQSNNQPRDGENDLYETTTDPSDRHQFYTFIHKPNGSSAQQDYTIHQTSAASWHTIVMEWLPSSIKIYRDGSLVKTLSETSADKIPDNPQFAAIQLDAFGGSVNSTVAMEVDYIKVWSAC